MPKYVRDRIEGYDTGWWKIAEDGTDRVYNRYGASRTRKIIPEDKVVEADSFVDLDWTPILLREGSEYGWLTPDGKWYPCDQSAHHEVAELILHKTEDQCEAENYVRVYESETGKKEYISRKRISHAQREALLKQGFSKEELSQKAKMEKIPVLK